MQQQIKYIAQLLLTTTGKSITNLVPDNECKEYDGYNFQVGSLHFKFRTAKITPKKVGQFVTLWKRNELQQTQPFDEDDHYDYYVFVSEEQDKLGFFIFPKSVLIDQNILTTKSKEGKRGFRLYPPWSTVANKQAEKTQLWQTKYFIDLNKDEIKSEIMLNAIMNT